MSLEEEVRTALEACLPRLSDDAAREVRHYLEDDEPEMAFEGCMLALIGVDRLSAGVGFSTLSGLARRLRLDREPVFDGDFWGRFSRWGERLSGRVLEGDDEQQGAAD